MADLMDHASPPVRLTRRTLLDVFLRVKNKKAAIDSPREWAAVAVARLKEALADHLVNGIEYTRVADLPGADKLPPDAKWYDMQQILDEKQLELFAKHIEPVDSAKDKTIYDRIPCDSDIERDFVKALEGRQDVELFVKLPSWFTLETPVGNYQPDWAIVMKQTDDEASPLLYLVSETKDPDWRTTALRFNERRKIKCGARHFGSKQLGEKGALMGVDYKVVSSAGELP
ncbi:MAG: hypothetical protein ISS72_11320 [Candidatus Brocadiae bacterium]|nr:hypothetical protein [Candidatus Brocadiia bacterium]